MHEKGKEELLRMVCGE